MSKKRTMPLRLPNGFQEAQGLAFDEVQSEHFHLERMDDGHLWLRLGDQTYDLRSRAPIYVVKQ